MYCYPMLRRHKRSEPEEIRYSPEGRNVGMDIPPN